MTPKLFFDALTDYKLWMHCILNLLSLTPAGGINVYGLSVIKAFGFSTEHANLLSSSVLYAHCLGILCRFHV
jgi:hypothetical protein